MTEQQPVAPAVPGVTRYRVREPIFIEAIQRTGDNEEAIRAFAGDFVITPLGCYLARGVTGHLFTVDSERFAAAYEPAPASAVPLADGMGPADGTWRERAEAAEAKLAAFEAHRPAVLDALRIAVADTAYSSRAGRFTAALEALDGSEGGTRHGG